MTFMGVKEIPNFSLTFGLVVFAGVVITAPISGANLNPAVTVGLFASGRVKLIRAILYIIVQCLGGIGMVFLFLDGQHNIHLNLYPLLSCIHKLVASSSMA